MKIAQGSSIFMSFAKTSRASRWLLYLTFLQKSHQSLNLEAPRSKSSPRPALVEHFLRAFSQLFILGIPAEHPEEPYYPIHLATTVRDKHQQENTGERRAAAG